MKKIISILLTVMISFTTLTINTDVIKAQTTEEIPEIEQPEEIVEEIPEVLEQEEEPVEEAVVETEIIEEEIPEIVEEPEIEEQPEEIVEEIPEVLEQEEEVTEEAIEETPAEEEHKEEENEVIEEVIEEENEEQKDNIPAEEEHKEEDNEIIEDTPETEGEKQLEAEEELVEEIVVEEKVIEEVIEEENKEETKSVRSFSPFLVALTAPAPAPTFDLEIGAEVELATIYEVLNIDSTYTSNLANSDVAIANNGRYRIVVNNKYITSLSSLDGAFDVGNGSDLEYKVQQAYKHGTLDYRWKDVEGTSGTYSVTRYGHLVCGDENIYSIKIGNNTINNPESGSSYKVYVGDTVVVSAKEVPHFDSVITARWAEGNYGKKDAEENTVYETTWENNKTYYKNLTFTVAYTMEDDSYEFIENENIKNTGIKVNDKKTGYKFEVTPKDGYYVKSITVEEKVDGLSTDPEHKTIETDLSYTNGVATTNNVYLLSDLSEDGKYVVTAEIVPELVANENLVIDKYSTDLKNHALYVIINTVNSVIKSTDGEINFSDLTVEYDVTNNDYYKELTYTPGTQLGHKFGTQETEKIKISWKSNNNKYTNIAQVFNVNVYDWIKENVTIDSNVDNFDKFEATGNKVENVITYSIKPNGGYYIEGVTVTANKGESSVGLLTTGYEDGTYSFSFDISGREEDTHYTIAVVNKCEYSLNDDDDLVLWWIPEYTITADNKSTWEEKIIETILTNKVDGGSFVVKYNALAGNGNETKYEALDYTSNELSGARQHAFGKASYGWGQSIHNPANYEEIRLEYIAADEIHTNYKVEARISTIDTREEHINVIEDPLLLEKEHALNIDINNLVTITIYPKEGKYVDSITVNNGTDDLVLGEGNPSYDNGAATVTFTMYPNKDYTITSDIKDEYIEDGGLTLNYVHGCGMVLTDSEVLDTIIKTRLIEDVDGQYEIKYRSLDSTVNSYYDEYNLLSHEGGAKGGYLNQGKTHAFGVESDGITPRETELIRIKFTSDNDKYTDFEISKEITLFDGRLDSKIYLNPSLTSSLNVLFVKYADSASLKETIAQNITVYGVYEDGSLVYPPVEFDASDLELNPDVLDAKYLKAQPITITFKGNAKYKPTTNDLIKIYVSHLYSDIDVTVKSKPYKEGEPATINVTTKPAGINYISVVAGLEGDATGLISINHDTTKTRILIENIERSILNFEVFDLYEVIDLAIEAKDSKFIDMIRDYYNLPQDIDLSRLFIKDGDYYYFDYGYYLIENQLPKVLKGDVLIENFETIINDFSEKITIDTDYLNSIITVANTIKQATTSIPENKLDIKFNADIEDAGIYTVIAATLEKNYNTAIDTETFTIFSDTKEDVLEWNQELPNKLGIIPYKTNEEGKLDFVFGVKDVEGLIENNNIVAGARNQKLSVLYSGLTTEGEVYLSKVAPEKPGAYTESFILTGNIADAKVRSFIIQRVGTEIEIHNTTLTYGEAFPGKEFPDTGKIKDANGGYVYNDEFPAYAVIHFEGVTATGKAYSSYLTPTEVGVYHMTATYSGNSDYQPTLSITKTLTIVPKAVNVQFENTTIEYGSEDYVSYNFYDLVDVEDQEEKAVINGLVNDDTIEEMSRPFYFTKDKYILCGAPTEPGYYYVGVRVNSNYFIAENEGYEVSNNKKFAFKLFHIYSNNQGETEVDFGILDTAVNDPEHLQCEFTAEEIQNIIEQLYEDDIPQFDDAMLVLNLNQCSSSSLGEVVNQGNHKDIVFFDLSLTLFTEKDNVVEETSITNTSKPLPIRIKLTEEQVEILGTPSNSFEYFVIREHENDDGSLSYDRIPVVYESVVIDEETTEFFISFSCDKFSSFALCKSLIQHRYNAPNTGIN